MPRIENKRERRQGEPFGVRPPPPWRRARGPGARPIELLLGGYTYDPGVDLWSLGCIVYEMFTRTAGPSAPPPPPPPHLG